MNPEDLIITAETFDDMMTQPQAYPLTHFEEGIRRCMAGMFGEDRKEALFVFTALSGYPETKGITESELADVFWKDE